MTVPINAVDLAVDEGRDIAVSDWIAITQALIDQFADATGDRQWIHTDPARAAATPFGTSIAHGFLTLSLVTRMAANAMAIGGTSMAINYGLNRVRFVTPVPSGSRIRGRFAVADLTPVEGGVQVGWRVTIELEGASRPCCVADWIVRYLR